MKKVLLTLSAVLFCITLSFGQSTSSNTDGASGSNNGCKDGIRTVNSSNYLNTLNSILNNPYISNEYKDAYLEAFYRCRYQELDKDKKGAGLTDFANCKLFGNKEACKKLGGNQ